MLASQSQIFVPNALRLYLYRSIPNILHSHIHNYNQAIQQSPTTSIATIFPKYPISKLFLEIKVIAILVIISRSQRNNWAYKLGSGHGISLVAHLSGVRLSSWSVTCTFIEFRMLLGCDASGTESFRYRLQCTLYRKFSTACALGSGDTVSLGIILPAYLISEVHQLWIYFRIREYGAGRKKSSARNSSLCDRS